MKLVKPGFEVIAASGHPELPYDYARPLELIEAAGRTCYKSEGKAWKACPDCGGTGFIEPPPPDCDSEDDALREFGCGTCDGGKWKTSAEKFVDMLYKRGHYAMLEHSWACGFDKRGEFDGAGYHPSPFITAMRSGTGSGSATVAGNLRALAEFIDGTIDDFIDPNDFLEPWNPWPPTLGIDDAPFAALTVRIVCDRGVTHEIVRHRPCSFAQESTRYCNYGGGVTFVIPPWVEISEGDYQCDPKKRVVPYEASRPGTVRTWWEALACAELLYVELLEAGWRPEQARAVLPNSLKTEIVVTASLEEWRHIFKLRTAPAAHPQMREIMVPLQAEARRLFPGVFGEA